MTTKTKPTATKAAAAKTAPKTPRKKPTGSRAAVGATTARVEQMRSEAFAMLVRGLKCPAIGQALGVSRVRAWQLANEGMEQLRSETLDQAEQVRLMQTERHMRRLQALDTILEAVDAKGQFINDAGARTAAAARATGIEAELAKLWGSYMPTKIAATTPEGDAAAVPNVFAVPLVAASVEEWLSNQSPSQPQS